MKIGYFVTSFPYVNPLTGEIASLSVHKPYITGGVENVAYNLAAQMAKKGHNVSIFTTSSDSTNHIENYGNIIVYRYSKIFTIGQCPISLSLLYKPLFSGIKLDIVHTHMGNFPAPLIAYIYAKKMKKNLIVSYHGDWIGGFGGIMRKSCVYLYNFYLCNKILSNADVIISLSKNHVLESKFLKSYSDKLSFVPNGVNIDEFNNTFSKEECRQKLNLSLHKKIILFVGNLNPIKAPHILLKAMKKVLAEIPDSYLIFIGDGICRTKLLELATKLGIASNVKFLGHINDNCLKALYYKSSDIFVLPSMSESFGIVLLEASASELPLVATNLESLKVIIQNGYNGLLIQKENFVDLANKIIFLLNNEILRKQMGRNARDKAKTFSWGNIANETEQIYLNLG